jgi:hypothetical protein
MSMNIYTDAAFLICDANVEILLYRYRKQCQLFAYAVSPSYFAFHYTQKDGIILDLNQDSIKLKSTWCLLLKHHK